MPTLNRTSPILLLAMVCCAVTNAQQPSETGREPTPEQLEFFEARVRPLLIEHCLECHSAETEVSGGLSLDARANWERGGDSGLAIVAHDPEASPLMRAVRYDDPDLQMPPEGKLPDTAIEVLRAWIEMGAPDPRAEVSVKSSSPKALAVEDAQQHWAYRAVQRPEVPASLGSSTATDAFIDANLQAAGIEPLAGVTRAQWLRRLSFDLHGLPPTPEMLAAFEADERTDARERMVDRLLNSPRFGETFARHWMDVARYAESITLRGFVLPEAWRYRDYLIEAFNDDRPFDQMIVEQVAGDLLSSTDRNERTRQLTAMGLLTLGNTNLEEQDKTQLDMDYIDEQLEVLGRAFLGQTIGCARCHDHKFDPIPTRDYYALAGIFRNTVAMEHSNVSKWIEEPLPLEPELEKKFTAIASELKQLSSRVAALKKKGNGPDSKKSVDVSKLNGIVVDDVDAKLIGDWVDGTTVAGFVNARYLHDGNQDKGMKTATFEPKQLPPGEYLVRMSYTTGANRASNAKVVVFSADGETALRVNEQNEPEDGIWLALGKFRFEKDGQAFVIVSNADSDGHVVVDAVHFAPVGFEIEKVVSEEPKVDGEELKQLEKEVAKLQSELANRPSFMTVREKTPAKDIPILIRGNIHSEGQVVPRGFLAAVDAGDASRVKFDAKSSGRMQLARWLSDARNPLTARVYANRVWSWLIGQGLVTTTSNFGTTGTSPSHPELLDWLADELVRSGWSTKHLVRCIVMSDVYSRRVADAASDEQRADVNNQLLWRGNLRRVSIEALRDAMLSVSGEVDLTVGGSLLKGGVKEDYNYVHQTTRRSVYHPVLRNSLPELFDAFDFADTSVSIGERARSTVAPQALIMMNHPWVIARSEAAAKLLANEVSSPRLAVERLYQRCLGRSASDEELAKCLQFLCGDQSEAEAKLDVKRLTAVVQSMFASLDFRYLE